MNVSKEEFVKETQRRMAARKQLKFETNQSCFLVRERGIRRVTHGMRKAHEI
jgi:hypothetical protein